MTIAEHKRLKQTRLDSSNIQPYQKISNTFIDNTLHKGNASALKIMFYLATVINDLNSDNQFVDVKIDLKSMLEYTSLTSQDIRNNLIAMQKISISFINDNERVETHINLLPYIEIQWGRSSIELKLFSRIAQMIIDVKKNYTFINTKTLMSLKSKHSLRLLPLLNKISNYDKHVSKRKRMQLDDLNEFFGTNYKTLYDIERKILLPAKKELDSTSNITFDFQVNFNNLGKGRPKAIDIVIDVIERNSYQGTLI